VADDAEWLRAYRALIASFGLVGRIVDGDPETLDDATVLARHRTLPVVRIQPAEGEKPLRAGAWDPGGRGWLAASLVSLAAVAAVLVVLAEIGAAARARTRAAHPAASL
jgi:hypothetical protein